MTAQCSTCFFGQTLDAGGNRLCRVTAPQPNAGGAALWFVVEDTDWCGLGADNAAGTSFSSALSGLPTPQPVVAKGGILISGTVTSTTITDSSVTTHSDIVITPFNNSAASLLAGGYYISNLATGSFHFVTLNTSAGGEFFEYAVL